jgi:hypothetical protein
MGACAPQPSPKARMDDYFIIIIVFVVIVHDSNICFIRFPQKFIDKNILFATKTNMGLTTMKNSHPNRRLIMTGLNFDMRQLVLVLFFYPISIDPYAV